MKLKLEEDMATVVVESVLQEEVHFKYLSCKMHDFELCLCTRCTPDVLHLKDVKTTKSKSYDYCPEIERDWNLKGFYPTQYHPWSRAI